MFKNEIFYLLSYSYRGVKVIIMNQNLKKKLLLRCQSLIVEVFGNTFIKLPLAVQLQRVTSKCTLSVSL